VATIFTIGHSTREWDDFVATLKAHQIATLFDIRAFPMSRRLPHFNREHMEQALADAGIEYVWEKEMGGDEGSRCKIRPTAVCAMIPSVTTQTIC
jgi:uncharacterized protein (DUF488 family)